MKYRPYKTPLFKMYQNILIWVDYLCKKEPVSAPVILQIIKDLTKDRPTLLRLNNFFAITDKNGKFKKYATPADGIKAGMELITKNPQLTAQKVGTLKANNRLQLAKIRAIIGIQPK